MASISFSLSGDFKQKAISYFLNLLFGDSSYIIYYLRAIGFKISLKDQTGSNLGVSQKHDTPFLCEIGKGTLISDGLSLINADVSNSSFRLRKVSIGANSFIGNNVFYSAESKVGENCLLATKAMVPIGGPELKNVGLLGSPPFEIPRSVARDKQLEHYRDGPTFKDRLFRKNISNTITMILFLASQWFFVHLITLLSVIEISQYHEQGWTALLDFTLIVLAVTVAYYALIERASIGFENSGPGSARSTMITTGSTSATGSSAKSSTWRCSPARRSRVSSGGCWASRSGRSCSTMEAAFRKSPGFDRRLLHDQPDGHDPGPLARRRGVQVRLHPHRRRLHHRLQRLRPLRRRDRNNVVLKANSFLMKGEHLAANSTWRGDPARDMRKIP